MQQAVVNQIFNQLRPSVDSRIAQVINVTFCRADLVLYCVGD